MSKSLKTFFCENHPESLDIATVLEIIELSDEHVGTYAEVLKKIYKHFKGPSLVTFIQKSKTVNNYADFKKILLARYDTRKFYKPEDELSKLTDQQFDKFMKFITAFEQINAQIDPALTDERQIELFIRGISDTEIKKAIDENSPKTLIDAMNTARLKANSKFKYDSLDFYNSGYINKFIEQNQEQPVQQNPIPPQLRPTQLPTPPSGRHPEKFQQNYGVKQEQNYYTNRKIKNKKYNRYNEQNTERKNFKCFKCGREGHYANKCNEEINSITEQVATTTTNKHEQLKRVSLFGVININDQPTRALIDTGSTITMIHSEFAEHLKVKIESCNNDLRAANGSKINIKGKTTLTIAIGEKKYTIHSIYVTDNFEFKCLIGINTLKIMKACIDIGNEKLISDRDIINLFTYGSIPMVENKNKVVNTISDQDYHLPYHAILQENINAVSVENKRIQQSKPSTPVVEDDIKNHSKDTTVKKEVEEGLLKLKFPDEEHKRAAIPLIIKYQDIFTNILTEPGCMVGVEHQIKLTQKDVSFQAYPVKFTVDQREFLDDHIKELLKYKIIKESSSPVSSSVVLRPKGSSWRMCINYTKLNNFTVKDRYPIPDINEIWNQIKGSEVFSKLDMVSGYHQIPIRDEDKYSLQIIVVSVGVN